MSSVSKDIELNPNSFSRSLIRRLAAESSGVHAVIIHGAEGAPVLETAKLIAQTWLCASPRNGEPCLQCRPCHAFGNGNLVDFKLIAPSGRSSLIRISAIAHRPDEEDDEPQPLQEFFRTAPLFAAKKVAVIHQAHRMNNMAANSLLKMLEEPHPYAKLVLTTTSPGVLLPTIQSRCASVPVESLGVAGPKSKGEEMIYEITRRIEGAERAEALALADQFRLACSKLEEETDAGARGSTTLGLTALASALLTLFPARPELVLKVIESHRRAVGNAGASLLLDALFSDLIGS